MARARFLVRGLVQGVGYRWFVRRAAERLGLSGVARNLDDGSVEVLVQGDNADIASLELELRRGPSMARVQRVDKSELPHEIALPKGFETD
ncbi:MAG TPA: acylphosphatase [Gemmatimonadales bacterium]|nr:acylphosphatase [Gemmatimonadales bacterium]